MGRKYAKKSMGKKVRENSTGKKYGKKGRETPTSGQKAPLGRETPTSGQKAPLGGSPTSGQKGGKPSCACAHPWGYVTFGHVTS